MGAAAQLSPRGPDGLDASTGNSGGASGRSTGELDGSFRTKADAGGSSPVQPLEGEPLRVVNSGELKPLQLAAPLPARPGLPHSFPHGNRRVHAGRSDRRSRASARKIACRDKTPCNQGCRL